MGWDYALAWLTVLPFELIAASITIRYWREDLDMGIWVGTFLFLLIIIQVFGVRGYGEGEHFLTTSAVHVVLTEEPTQSSLRCPSSRSRLAPDSSYSGLSSTAVGSATKGTSASSTGRIPARSTMDSMG